MLIILTSLRSFLVVSLSSTGSTFKANEAFPFSNFAFYFMSISSITVKAVTTSSSNSIWQLVTEISNTYLSSWEGAKPVNCRQLIPISLNLLFNRNCAISDWFNTSTFFTRQGRRPIPCLGFCKKIDRSHLL